VNSSQCLTGWLRLKESSDASNARSSAPRGSSKRQKLALRIKRLREKATNRTENWARHTAQEIVDTYEVIALEELQLANRTRSAAGTIEEPGTNVSQKRGLNRSLQNAALGMIATQVHVRAENAGRRTWIVPASYSSQECGECGHTEEGNRPSRSEFRCLGCGHEVHADTNAGWVIRRRAEAAEEAWKLAGSPPLVRVIPRMRRRKPVTEGAGHGPPA